MSYKAILYKLTSGDLDYVVKMRMEDARQFLAVFKVTPEEFDRLYKMVEAVAKTQLRRRLSSREDRERKVGGGRPYGVCLYAMLGMCLLMFNGCSPYMAASLFGTNRNAARTSLEVVRKALLVCLPIPKRVSLSIARVKTRESLLKWIPELEAILDASNYRATKSPFKASRRRQYGRLSGPHRKVQMLVNKLGLILHISHSIGSRMHDKRLAVRECPDHILAIVERLHRDLGYQGVNHGAAEVVEPFKATRGHKLTDEQREINKERAAARSPVECKQGHVKNFGILDKRGWNDGRRFDEDMQIVCGLLNLLTIWRSKYPVDWGNPVDVEKRQKRAKDMEPLLQDWMGK